MSTSLAPNTTTTIQLPAGQVVVFQPVGDGAVSASNQQLSNVGAGVGGGRVGPFTEQRSVYIQANGSALSFDVVTPGAAAVAGAVSGAGNLSATDILALKALLNVGAMPSYSLAAYNGNDLAAASAFDSWLGRQADMQVVFFNQSSWANFEAGIDYETALFGSRRCLWSVPLAAAYGTLPGVVAGTYDSTFNHCAQSILTAQPGNYPILIRLGWEFNLLGQEQRAFDGSGNPTPTVWVSAFRRVVGLFRAFSSRFRFMWCSNIGDAAQNGLTVTDCYPGNDVVDLIGMDLYFTASNGDVDTDGGAGTFGYRKTQGAGLDWSVAFAAAHGKPWCIPEWGVQSNLATSYMESLCAYIRANAAFQGVWNSNAAAQTKLSDDARPALSAIYKKYFGRPAVSTVGSDLASTDSSAVVALTANQPVAWNLVSGSGPTLAGSNLTFAPQPNGVTSTATVRATNIDGYSTDKDILRTFRAPYSFANAEASAFVARITAAPTETRKAQIDTLIGALKAGALSGSNLYAKADAIWLAGPDAQAATLNVKSGAYGTIVPVNSPVYTTDAGYQGLYDGTSPRSLDMGIALNRSGNLFTQNSASLAAWNNTDVADGSVILGNNNLGTGVQPKDGSGNASAKTTGFSTGPSVAVTSAKGLLAVSRSSASAEQMYKNGVLVASTTTGDTSGGVGGGDKLRGLCSDPLYPTPRQLSFAWMGSSLTATEHKDLYNAVRAYLVAIGLILAGDYAVAV